MNKYCADVEIPLSIHYDDIEAESKEEAEKIAIERAQEDIEFNNCDAGEPDCWCCYESEKDDK